MSFYTAIVNFDMSTYSEVKVKSFLNLENANKWAIEEKQEFLNQIPCNGALDEEQSDHEYDDLFFFYGVSRDGENFVTIRVIKDTFVDEKL